MAIVVGGATCTGGDAFLGAMSYCSTVGRQEDVTKEGNYIPSSAVKSNASYRDIRAIYLHYAFPL